MERVRVQRVLARAGVASRRGADELVAAGRVTVNGVVALVGQTVDPAKDIIMIDGHRVQAPKGSTWIVLHKPAGVLTTRDDPGGRTTVFDLVDDQPGLTYVGRLDYMTEGVLLMTTDGVGANALMHPSSEVERTYVAVVRGDAPGAARIAKRGIQLDDGWVNVAHIEAHPLDGRRHYELEITLAEGRNREVRRICETLGLEVERLVRTSFGPVKLGTLASGETRAPTRREMDVLEAIGQTWKTRHS